MKAGTLIGLVLILALAALAAPTHALILPTSAPAAQSLASPPPSTWLAKGACGDGVCDEVESKHPDLRPQEGSPGSSGALKVASPTPVREEGGEAWESVTLPSGEVAHRGDPNSISQEGGVPGAERQVNLALILDASGSMLAELPGTGKSKLVVAKEVMAELIPQIPAEINGALWAYGHRYPEDPKEESCRDIERIFALGPVDAAAYVQKINAINAIGYTPISDSIEQAARDLPPGDLNSIILVSDGEETCGGDPCALAEALKASDTAVTIHVVGYAVKDVAQKQLQCIAQVSGGTYHDAGDAAGLLRSLKEAMAATVSETILRVEVLGPDGKEVHNNVYLYEAGTDRRVSGYVAWKDNAVPPGTFDLRVDTLPWTVYQNLSIPEGSTTVVRIRLGALRVLTPDGEETTADVYDADTGTRLGYYGGATPLVPGEYYVVVNGSLSDPIVVESGKTTDLVLGAIRVLTPDGEETTADVYDADTGARLGYYGGVILLAPGRYYVSINGSTSDPFTVKSGETGEVLLGAIQVDGDFEIHDAAGKRLGFYSGTLLLAPGQYVVKVSDGPTYDDVVVEPGRVTVLQ
jgi:hypothetical protein